MKLYYAPGACSLAPHIALREAERRFDLERVDLRTKRTASGADYRAINPKGYVPALALDEPGTVILTEVPAVLVYVADLAPETRLAPPAGTFARYHLLEWLAFVSSELHKQFGPMFAPDPQPAWIDAQRRKIGERLLYVEEVLATREVLLGETFSVADAYLFVILRWCDQFGIDLGVWPSLTVYRQRIAERPAVRAALDAEGLGDAARTRKTG